MAHITTRTATFLIQLLFHPLRRCHRLGQTKAVRVYRMITKDTYEQKMFTMASMKLGLDKAVLQTMSISAKAGSKGTIFLLYIRNRQNMN
jgi:hypothetical protein